MGAKIIQSKRKQGASRLDLGVSRGTLRESCAIICGAVPRGTYFLV